MIIDVVILAAGQGSRMKSNKPKVLHKIAGKSMLEHVIVAANELDEVDLHIVVGHGAEKVQQAFPNIKDWIVQEEQLGTGHAVLQAMPNLHEESTTLVLYGDVPLIETETLEKLLEIARRGGVALLTVDLDDPSGYGRIVRAANNKVIAIVEHKDASDAQLNIHEVNTGIMALPTPLLRRWLPQLSSDNAQGEFYLTDVIAFAAHDGIPVDTAHPHTAEEVQGVNDRDQLAQLERHYQTELADKLMSNGVSIVDPKRIDIRGSLKTGYDVTIDINAVFEGNVRIGNDCIIGAGSIISNSTIGDNVTIKPYSIIEDSIINDHCVVGPYARLRPGTKLEESAKIGNFVETKKTVVGKGSKINHLSYVGDASLGEGVNIGAGTITCNYDGVNKHQTMIADGAFIGSNTSLVAPVSVGSGATIGAGSTITSDVEQDGLAVARGKQRVIKGWKRPEKKS